MDLKKIINPIEQILDITRFTPAAHRGASREFPENTVDSFRRALEIFPRCILETDVRSSADGVAVLRHDRLLETTTDGKGPIASFSWEELRRLDAGHNVSFDGGATYPFRGRGYRLATLDQVLKEFPGALFSIDIKERNFSFADLAIDTMRYHRAEGRVIVGSFDNEMTGYLRKTYPSIARHAGFGQVLGFLARTRCGMTKGFRALDQAFFVPEVHFGISSEYRGFLSGMRIITKRFIDEAHRKGMPVFAWTINEKDNMRRLIRWGVNGIVTDYPNRLKEAIEEEGR